MASSKIWILIIMKIELAFLMNKFYKKYKSKMRLRNQWLILICFMGFSCTDKIIQLELSDATATFQKNTLVRLKLSDLLKTRPFQLVSKNSKGSFEIPYQIEGGYMYWLSGLEPSQYVLVMETPSIQNKIKMIEKEGQLEVYRDTTKIVGYQMAVKHPPAGEDSAYKRSGYLHPVNTPSGKRLTRIQPQDHYHHYGIWNPWTHTVFDRDTLDFWNLNKKQATVRFAKMLKQKSGPVFSEFEVLHEHVVLKNQIQKVALNETQKIKIFPINENQYLMDITINYECATAQPFKIIKYRYGGFGWRTTEEWNNQNSRVLTSEGNTRKNADGSTARWCIVDGKLDEGYGGALMLSHLENYNHPEPLRVWPENQYGRGDLFVNFATTKTTDWTLDPGKIYTLKYQLLIYDGKMETTNAEALWDQFVHPTTYRIKP